MSNILSEIESGYLKPFLDLLRSGGTSAKRPAPEWLLGFKTKAYFNSSDFLYASYASLLSSNKKQKVDFHSETGLILKRLYEYAKDLPSMTRTFDFLEDFRAFMRGETDKIPAFCGGAQEAYAKLKYLEGSPYALRLIDEYVDYSTFSKLKTQDFTALYRVSVYDFAEVILCSLSVDEVIKFVESKR